jgi:hypothetical protein
MKQTTENYIKMYCRVAYGFFNYFAVFCLSSSFSYPHLVFSFGYFCVLFLSFVYNFTAIFLFHIYLEYFIVYLFCI